MTHAAASWRGHQWLMRALKGDFLLSLCSHWQWGKLGRVALYQRVEMGGLYLSSRELEFMYVLASVHRHCLWALSVHGVQWCRYPALMQLGHLQLE